MVHVAYGTRIRIRSMMLAVAALVVASIGLSMTPLMAQTSYTCFPTCTETDGRFLSIAGPDLNTLAGQNITMTLTSPGDASQLEFGIFDGETGGHWDRGTAPLIYTLYADPAGNGNGTTQIGEWGGDSMPDNAWYTIRINNVAQALTPGGNYFYTLRIRSSADISDPAQRGNWSNFKIRTNGTINLRPGQAFNITAPLFSAADALTLYPSYPDLSQTTYDGNWTFYLYVPVPTASLAIWDGDMDYGAFDCSTLDVDDPDTPDDTSPVWATGTAAVSEGVAQSALICANGDSSTSNPNDDSPSPVFRREPSIYYELVDPTGTSYVNTNPSGNLEWEQFAVSTADYDSTLMDYHADSIPAGVYQIKLMGMDLANLNAWRFGFTALGVGDPYIVGVDSAGAPVIPPPPVPPANGSVAGTLFFDGNSNGTQDADETGITSVVVRMAADYDNNGTVDETFTTVTDANGAYSFTALKAGHFTVTCDISSVGNNLVATFDSDGTGTANTVTGTLDASHSQFAADFGYRRVISATVTGPDTVMASTDATFSVNAPAGSTVNWTVTGATISGSATGSTVAIQTGNFGTITLSVTITKDGTTITLTKKIRVSGVDFVLFAYNSLNFKGRDTDTTRGFIDGNVGVNARASTSRCGGSSPVLTLGGGSCTDHAVYVTDGNRVMGDYVDLGGSKVSLYDLYANRLTSGSTGAHKRNSGPTSFTAPIIASCSLPVVPSFTYGCNSVTVNCNATMTLNPGKYGSILVRSGGHLNLGSGIYNIKSLKVEDRATVNTTDGTKMRIASSMVCGTDCYVGPSNIALFIIRGDGGCGSYCSYYSSSVDFGYRTQFHGQVFSPNGTIDLGKKTDLFGRFWGKTITSDYDVNVSYYSPVTVLTQHNNDGFQKKFLGGQAVAGEGNATLSQNFPNPFSASTTIGFTLTQPGAVTVRIVDGYGNEVRTLLDNAAMSSGAGSVNWDGRSAAGVTMPSGTYFCQLRAGDAESTRPIVLVRQ